MEERAREWLRESKSRWKVRERERERVTIRGRPLQRKRRWMLEKGGGYNKNGDEDKGGASYQKREVSMKKNEVGIKKEEIDTKKNEGKGRKWSAEDKKRYKIWHSKYEIKIAKDFISV